MRKILTLSVLLLVFCIGCPPAPPTRTDPPTPPVVDSDPIDEPAPVNNVPATQEADMPVVPVEPPAAPEEPPVAPEEPPAAPAEPPAAPEEPPAAPAEPPAAPEEPPAAPEEPPAAPAEPPAAPAEPPAAPAEPPAAPEEPPAAPEEPPAAPAEPPAAPEEPPAAPAEPPAAPAEPPAAPAEQLAMLAGGVPLPPLDDLTVQIEIYITEIEKALENLDGSANYAVESASVVRDASAVALLALAVGLADAESKYKKSAPHVIAATKLLTAAENFESGKAAFAALQASLTNTGEGTPLSWSDKVSDLAPAMKALPALSSSVKRLTDTERKLNTVLTRQPQRVFPQLAAMAVISQGAIPNVAQTEKPDAIEEWKKVCEEFRDIVLKTGAAARQYAEDAAAEREPDYAAFDSAIKAMALSCDDCHKVFYPSAVGQTE